MLLSSMSCAQNSPSENVSFRLHQPLQVTCQFEGINLIYNNRRIKVIINNSNKKNNENKNRKRQNVLPCKRNTRHIFEDIIVLDT